MHNGDPRAVDQAYATLVSGFTDCQSVSASRHSSSKRARVSITAATLSLDCILTKRTSGKRQCLMPYDFLTSKQSWRMKARKAVETRPKTVCPINLFTQPHPILTQPDFIVAESTHFNAPELYWYHTWDDSHKFEDTPEFL